MRTLTSVSYPRLAPRPEYLALDAETVCRAEAYRAMFADALADELVAEIRHHLAQEGAF